MAISVDQMAGAYLTNMIQELERIRNVAAEHQTTIVAMEAHIEECKASMQPAVAPPAVVPSPLGMGVPNADGSTTEKLKLPNPFDEILTKVEQN